MRKIVVTGTLVALGTLVVGLALADDDNEGKRKDLIEDIDDAVEDAGDELSGFESDSDDGDVRDALNYISQVERLVDQLDDVKDNDSKANEIVSRYPRYISDFRQAAQYLTKLKQGQRLADGAADKCTNDESNLQTLIRNYVGNPDNAEEAFTKLPEKAKEYQRVWQPQLEAWKKNDPEMANAASYARFSVSDGEWSRVSSSVSNAVNGMHNHWRERYAAAERACPRVGLGEKHPDVEKALEELTKYTGNTKNTVTQLKKDYNGWLREVRKLREFSEKDRDELRTVMCGAGEYEMEKRVLEVADRWASQISSVYGTTLGQADRLKGRATDDKLKKYKGAKEVLSGVEKNIETMEKMKNYELQGSNNPKIRARLAWGNKRHDEIQSGLGCKYKEMTIEHCTNAIRPGSGCRADCLKISSGTCTMVEIKPDSSGGKDEGPRQVEAYRLGLIDWYKKDKKSLFDKYPDLSACESSDKTDIRVERDVVYYEFCSGLVLNELGEVIKEISSDISESAD